MNGGHLRPPPSIKFLEGLRLAIVRRAATMLNLHFCKESLWPTPEGGVVGDFALHIDGPWRLRRDGDILAGRSDIWRYDGPGMEPEGWTYEEGHSAQDAVFDRLFERRPGERGWAVPAVGYGVMSADHRPIGDVTIVFANGIALDVFPDGVDECWRLFYPGRRNTDHLVVPDPDAG